MTDSEPVVGALPRPRHELVLRVASALVLAPLAIVAVWLGGAWFLAFWTIGAIGVLWECIRLVAGRRVWPVVPAEALVIVVAAWLLAVGRPAATLALLAIGLLLAAGLSPAGKRIWVAGGCVYAGALLVAPALLRGEAQHGMVALLFLFAVVWMTDIFAYLVGRAVGGRRVWPAVSPKKTWSGAIGGAVAAAIAGTVVAMWAGLPNLPILGIVSLGLSIVSQAGDFLESAFKRRFGAKDASHLIPGHGGLMDRLDGFLAAAVAAAALGVLRGGLHAPAQGLLIW
ncbi:MAG TPA: phosphatidate cytidylyltransferase [Xanthobacteraceae bacterium]|nr:phosphatidate cytidylyltransferase [Xanthobacteraceae bacterium]